MANKYKYNGILIYPIGNPLYSAFFKEVCAERILPWETKDPTICHRTVAAKLRPGVSEPGIQAIKPNVFFVRDNDDRFFSFDNFRSERCFNLLRTDLMRAGEPDLKFYEIVIPPNFLENEYDKIYGNTAFTGEKFAMKIKQKSDEDFNKHILGKLNVLDIVESNGIFEQLFSVLRLPL